MLHKTGLYAGVAAAMLLAGCQLPMAETGPLERETRSVALDQSELTRVELRMGAGELTLNGGAGNLVDAEFAYNVPAWKPTVEYNSTGVRSDLTIAQPSGSPAAGNAENEWKLRLNDDARLDLDVRLGAGEAHLNLGSLTLRNVEVQMGAGEVEMDLRGNPERSYDVDISGGVGHATVYVPTNVAVSATASGGIGDIDIDGLVERGGRWINPAQENNPVTVRLDVKGGIGEIRIIAE